MVTVIIKSSKGEEKIEINNFHHETIFNNSPKREEPNEVPYKFILDEMDYPILCYTLIKEGKEFIINYSNRELLKRFKKNGETLEGNYLSESSPFLKEIGVFNKLKEAHYYKEELTFKIYVYVEDILIYSFYNKIIPIKNRIYHIIHKSSDLDILSKSNRDLIKSSDKLLAGVIQSNNWVYINKKYSDEFNIKLNENNINDVEIIENNQVIPLDLEKDLGENIDLDQCKRDLESILNREEFLIIKTVKKGDKWFKQHLEPISFKNNPAIRVVMENITQDKLIEKSIKKLDHELKIVKKLNKIAIGSLNNDKMYWSDEIYYIFEIPVFDKIFDFNNFSNYNLFFDTFGKFLLKKDLIYLKEKLPKENFNFKEFHKKFKIVTGKNNIKTVILHFTVQSENPLKIIGYLQDVTESENITYDLTKLLSEYQQSYAKYEEEKLKLEDTINSKKTYIQEIYDKTNVNLDIFSELLNLELDIPHDTNKIIQNIKERISTIKHLTETYESFNLHDKINLKEFIDNYLKSTDYRRKYRINVNINGNYYCKSYEIDNILLILTECELLIKELIFNLNEINYFIELKDEEIQIIYHENNPHFEDEIETKEDHILKNIINKTFGTYSLKNEDGIKIEIKIPRKISESEN